MDAPEAMRHIEKAVELAMEHSQNWPDQDITDLEDAVNEMNILAKRVTNTF